MPTGATGRDIDFLQRFELGFADLHLVEEDGAGILRDAAKRCVADGAWLLINFLEHEVLEATLLRHDGIPGDVLRLPLHRLAVEIGNPHSLLSDHGKIAIGQKEKIAGVIEDGGHVGGYEVFVLAEADDGGRSVARRDDLVRFVDRYYHQRENAGEFLDGFAHSFLQGRPMTVSGLQVVLLDEVRDDFRVGFGGELVSFGDQLLLEREIVLDNAVVHDHDSAAAVAMGMGVLFGGAAVGGPAGVSDAVGAVERLEADHFFEVPQLAFGAADLQAFAVSGDRDSRRVVAAILQLSEALNDDGDDLLLAHISHDAAHWLGSLTNVSGGTGDGSAAPKGGV